MSLLSQLEAFVKDGTIAKAAKPRKKRKPKPPINPNIAKKYVRPGHRLPGERHGWSNVPVPKPIIYRDNRRIVEGKFVPIRPVTFKEETGHKSAIILTADDTSALQDLARHMKTGLMEQDEAADLIKFILRNALSVDGSELAILSNKQDEVENED